MAGKRLKLSRRNRPQARSRADLIGDKETTGDKEVLEVAAAMLEGMGIACYLGVAQALINEFD